MFNSYRQKTVVNLISSQFRAFDEGPTSDINAMSTSSVAVCLHEAMHHHTLVQCCGVGRGNVYFLQCAQPY